MPGRIDSGGFADPGTIPIGSELRLALDTDAAQFRSACTTLGTMALEGADHDLATEDDSW